MEQPTHEVVKKITVPTLVSTIKIVVSGVMVLALLCVWYIYTLTLAPPSFPTEKTVTIESGATVVAVGAQLKEAGIIRSETLFYLVVSLYFDPRALKASTYRFNEAISVYGVAERLMTGEYDQDLIRLTLIEGERARATAERAATLLPEFSSSEYLALAEPVEGTLFPETYFIPDNFTALDLFTLQQETYAAAIPPLIASYPEHILSEQDIITLASIVEREANTQESKRLVAGILLRRLTIGMPLQADASIEYVLDKPLSLLTPADLEQDTPYNTYRYRGLPPTPIGNPGTEAIQAVLEPTESPYLFYITDEDGVFHFAETYDEHLINIARYLR